MSNIFTHSGDLGDIIYSLPTIKAKGGGSLVLFDSPGKTAHGMTPQKVDRLRPLLERQNYIDKVMWSSSPVESSLNGFRHHMGHGNLADAHLATYGLDWSHRTDPWLNVDPVRKYRIIFSRSMRYNNPNFPWQDVVFRYGTEAAFVGFHDEYVKFCDEYGYVRYAEHQSDFLELAEIIAGCEMFVGNQSSPLAVAHGLKQRVLMEISPGPAHPHCVFQRSNCIIGWDNKIEIPVLDAIHPVFSTSRDYEVWCEVYFGREYKVPYQFPAKTLVVDIGAHIGAFSLASVHRGAEHVICIEPCSENVLHLIENMKGHANFTILEKALYCHDNGVSMKKCDGEATMLLMSDDSNTLIPSVSWKSLIPMMRGYENVVVKCDAEGAEYILASSDSDLSMVSSMFIKSHHGVCINGVSYSHMDCVRLLSNRGFSVKVHVNGPTTHILEASK